MKEYLKTIYNLYPQDIYASDLKYPYTPEMTRFFELQDEAGKNTKLFDDLSKSIAKDFDVLINDYSLGGVFNLVYKAMFHIPPPMNVKNFSVCVFNVSVLSKFYCVYLSKWVYEPITNINLPVIDENEKTLMNKVENRIKLFYPDYQPFPMEYYDELVPHIYSAKRPFEYATYFECLMTNHIL